MFDSEGNKEIIVCGKPPVNGNICEKLIAIDTDLTKITLVWSDELDGFAIEYTDQVFSYSQLERWYDKFVWVKNG